MDFILRTDRHSYRVEYYAQEISKRLESKDILIGRHDDQRPHDIEGEGNKFEPKVLFGLALGSREADPETRKKYVQPAIDHHREYQKHHKVWSMPESWNSMMSNPELYKFVRAENIALSALDTLCYISEYKGYDPRLIEVADIESMRKFINEQQSNQARIMRKVYQEMLNIPTPDVGRILCPYDLPDDMGLDSEMKEKIEQRSLETIRMLENDHGYSELELKFLTQSMDVEDIELEEI
ncbi:MAG: hypothetical protein V1729_05840 [Candidatus Woesearchaeota archaeon]